MQAGPAAVQTLELGRNAGSKRLIRKGAEPGGAPQEVLPGERELGAAATIANEITGAFSGAVASAVTDVAKAAPVVPSVVPEAPSPVTEAPSPVTVAPSPVTVAPSPAASDVGAGAGAASPAASDAGANAGAASPVSTGQAASTGGEASLPPSPAAPAQDEPITYGDAASGKLLTSAQALPPGVEWWENGGPQYAMVLTPTTMVDSVPSDQEVKEETKDRTMGVPFIFSQDHDSMPDSTIHDIAQVFYHPIPEEHVLAACNASDLALSVKHRKS